MGFSGNGGNSGRGNNPQGRQSNKYGAKSRRGGGNGTAGGSRGEQGGRGYSKGGQSDSGYSKGGQGESYGSRGFSKDGQDGKNYGKSQTGRYSNGRSADDKNKNRADGRAYRDNKYKKSNPIKAQNIFSAKRQTWKPVKKNVERFDENTEAKISEDLIYGRNPVIEALKSGRTLNRVFIMKDSHMPRTLTELLSKAKTESGTVVQEVDKDFLDRLTFSAIHQGVAAYVSPVSYVEIDDILKIAEDKNEKPFLIILDGIEDPHNLGAILRTAECLGVHGVIVPKRRAVPLSSTVSKASSGAIEYVPVARISNISQTISELKDKGLWIAGTGMDSEKPLYKTDLNLPLAVVIGGEGDGVGRLVSENCDFIINIPMKGRIQSLNASAAAAIIIYEVTRQREGV